MTRQILHARACYVDARNCMLVALERAATSHKTQALCRSRGDGRLACYDVDNVPPSGQDVLLFVTPNGEVHAP